MMVLKKVNLLSFYKKQIPTSKDYQETYYFCLASEMDKVPDVEKKNDSKHHNIRDQRRAK